MIESGCAEVREALSGPRAADEGVRAHLEGCAACAEEAELVRLLRAGRPSVPGGLAGRIKRSLGPPARTRRSLGGRPWWALAAASVAAVALGIGSQASDPSTEATALPAWVAEDGTSELWTGDDAEVAGAPWLGDLSEDVLLELLQELETGGSA